MTPHPPNGIRTESARTPVASIDTRYLHSTTRQIPVALATHQPVSISGPEPMRANKTCKQCGETKALDDFHRCNRNKDGRAYQCIACRKRYLAANREVTRAQARRWREANQAASKQHVANYAPKAKMSAREKRLSRYGLSSSDYDGLLDSQGGTCAICGKSPGSTALAVDHDHGTGQVRGLLCGRCNLGIGLLGDTFTAVTKAADYLLRSLRSGGSTC